MSDSELTYRNKNMKINYDIFLRYCEMTKEAVYCYINTTYGQKHRYFHNKSHLMDLFNQIHENEAIRNDPVYHLAALFHDCVYDSTRKDNEEKSVLQMLQFVKDINIAVLVKNIILDTKNLTKDTVFNRMDRKILSSNDFTELVDYENKIFKEYQYLPYEIYKQNRLDFLYSVVHIYPNLSSLISYVKARKINIGIYSGTFRSFHLGHANILEKANNIFDKVIIAKGQNDLKTDHSGLAFNDLVQLLKYNEVIPITYSSADLHKTYSENDCYSNVTVIKGIRSAKDLEDGMTLDIYSKILNNSYSMIYITCDPEFNHLSSSNINMLKKYDSVKADSLLFH